MQFYLLYMIIQSENWYKKCLAALISSIYTKKFGNLGFAKEKNL